MEQDPKDAFPEIPQPRDAAPHQPPTGPNSTGGPATPPPQPIPVYLPPDRSGPSVLARVFKSLMVSVLVLSVLFNLYVAIILVARMQQPMQVDEVEYRPGRKEQKIALIAVEGLIDMDSANDFRNALQHGAADDNVKAIVLVINSPGGQVAPSAMMYRYINQFIAEQKQQARDTRENSDDESSPDAYQPKKIYAIIQQVGASGAYWLAAAVERIYAQESAVVGSIGVIYVNLVLEEALNEKLGINPIVVKSTRSPYKDKGSPFRQPTETEKIEIREDLDAIHNRFVKAVTGGRRLSEEKAWALANGDVYDGHEALKNRLIDRVGFLDDVIDDLVKELDLDDPMVVRYVKPKTITELLTNARGSFAPALEIRQQIEEFATTPRIQALWLGR